MSDRRDQRARPVDRPEPGFFRMKLVPHGPPVAARICHRDGVWWAIVNGDPQSAHADPAYAPMVFRIWHGGDFITRAEYERMLQQLRAARAADANHPLAHPNDPIDLTKIPSIF